MNKKPISLALCLVMLLSVLPLSAFSTEGELAAPTCTCESECTADAMNAACAVCAAEGATPENCAKHTHPVDPTAEPTPTVTPEPTPTPETDDTVTLAAVQAMVDALPTADAATPADYDAFCAVCDALDALSPEQAEAITGMDKLEALGEYFASQVTTLDDPVTDPVAKIGETGYATLADAFNAAKNGETITLCKEADAVGDYNGGKTFSLDLAGKKLKTNLYTGVSIYLNSGTLTVTDSTEAPQSTSIQANFGSVLNIEGGSFDTININGGTVNIKGGTVNASTFSSGGALNISAADNGTVPTINEINCTGYNPPTLSFDSSFLSKDGVVGKLTANPGMNISCGAYKSIAVNAQRGPVSSSASSLLDILADGYAIFEEDSSGRSICNVKGVDELCPTKVKTYYVLSHTCAFGADGTCACGRVCEHTLGENGKCSGCGVSLRVKGEGGGTTKYYIAMPGNLQNGWTYTLLSYTFDTAIVSFSTVQGGLPSGRNATIDINGHKLSGINFSGGDSLKITDSVGGGSLSGNINLNNRANLTLDNIGGSLGSQVSVQYDSKLSFSGNTTPNLSGTSFVVNKNGGVLCGTVDFTGLKGNSKNVASISIESSIGLKLGSSNIGLVFESFTYTDNDDAVTQVAGLLLNAYPAIKLLDENDATIPANTRLNTFSTGKTVKVAACTKHEKIEVETLYKYVCKHCGQPIVAEMTSGDTTSHYIRLSEAVEAAGDSTVSIKMLNNSPSDSNGMWDFDDFTVTEGNITLDLNGNTLFGKLTVTGGTIKLKNDNDTLADIRKGIDNGTKPITDLLDEGYTYAVGKNIYLDCTNDKSYGRIFVVPAPIKSVTKSFTTNPATPADTPITYSDSLEIKMEITDVTDKDNTSVAASASYAWFKVDANGVESEVTSDVDTPNTLSLNKPNAGTYKYRCKITLESYTKPVDFDFTVNKATLTTPAAPTANTLNGQDLVFKPQKGADNVYTTTGVPQQLVSLPTGSATLTDGCEYEYKVGENGTWTSNIDDVTGTNAGTYNVYWRVNGGTNYQDYTPTNPIVVKIAPAVISNIIVKGLTKTEKTYDGTADLPIGNTPEYNVLLTNRYGSSFGNNNPLLSIILTPGEDFTCKLEYAKNIGGNNSTVLVPDANVGENKYIRATITLLNGNFVFIEDETTLVVPADEKGDITPAPLKVSAVEKQVKIGDEVPDLSNPVLNTDYKVEGLVNNETAAEIGLTDKLVLEYYDAEAKKQVTPDTSKAGTYMIVPSLKQPTAVVAALYALVNLNGDNSPDPLDNYELKFEPGKFIVTENPKYTITSKAGANGTISPLGVTTVEEGSSQTYVITPNPGYVIASVKVDGVNLGSIAKHTFSNIDRDHTIEATFMLPWGNPQTGVDVD